MLAGKFAGQLKGRERVQYRPHIDGLRTVAIVPVVLFHLDIALFGGGFVGVDVFFVISGFLITSLIVEEIATDRFSLWNFYKRRALRILPAFLVVILAVLAASWLLLFPDETRGLGRSAVAAALFVANIHFWRRSGYFDPELESAPLLHTWTLSVEEQYYIFLPIFLMAVATFLGRRYLAAILVVSAASFLLALWAVARFETAAFFMLPTRAWEFGLGSLAAVVRLPALPAIWRTGGALVGAGLILWGVFALNEDDPFPGANALWPCLGAVLLIVLAEGTAAGRLLATRPFVAIGRISYSLYLWHWPLIVFWKIAHYPVLGPGDVVLLTTLSLVAASLSYKLVEQPFRSPRMRARPARGALAAAAGAMALTAALGFGLVAAAPLWGRIPAELRAIADYADYRAKVEVHPCLIHARVPGGVAAFDPGRCLAPSDGRPTLLVLGDSHAEHLLPAIETAFTGFHVQSATATGCLPAADVSGGWYCPTLMRQVLGTHVPQAGIDVVLLSVRWRPGDAERLRQSVDYLLEHVRQVVILGPTPEFHGSFPLLLAREKRRGRDEVERFLDTGIRALDRQMAAQDWHGARYLSIYDLLCPQDCRRLTAGGVPYYADYGHYTRAAALEIAADLAQLLLAPE